MIAAILLVAALGWLAVCWAVDVSTRRPRAACDPVADSRAAASDFRAAARHDIPGSPR
ncbi:hypothetical protein [Streptomyces youssoufiensis]